MFLSGDPHVALSALSLPVRLFRFLVVLSRILHNNRMHRVDTVSFCMCSQGNLQLFSQTSRKYHLR